MTVKLTHEQLAVYLRMLPDWRHENEALVKTFTLPDFRGAIRFVNRIADAAEAEDHHPDIMISYRRVTLSLSTHDSGGVTGKDVALAQLIDARTDR